MSVLPPPPPDIHFLEDGTVEIHVGTEIGWVTSAHLIDTKVHQLQAAWSDNHSAL